MTIRTLTIDSLLSRIKPAQIFWAILLTLAAATIIRTVIHQTVSASAKSLSQSSSEADLVVLTNLVRHDLGRKSLIWNAQLYQAAQDKASDMLTHQYFDHTSPSGVTPWSFIHDTGYTYTSAGENLAEGFILDQAIVQAWMNSPAHRANIVDAEFTETAIATKTGALDGKVVTVVVQLFGQPTSFVSQLDESILGGLRRN